MNGYCSLPDSSCPSGNRYSDTAGAPYGGQCVGGSGSDGGVDTPGDGGGCYGTGLLKICLTNPAPTLTLGSAIDTDTEPSCLAAYPSVCAIGATELTVSTTVVATGSRPLVLVAADTLSIAGTLDASSQRGGTSGAGSRPACTMANGTANNTGAGGGAGGTFGGRGGNGGNGDNQNNNVAGGTSAPVAMQTMLVGGCGGSAGGAGGAAGGAGGRSGGALYLIAGVQLQIPGHVFASGAGGDGGSNNSGGGGGGTGGMIGLDAPTVTVTGSVVANGGGGGGGAGNGGGGAGSPGTDGATTNATTAAAGGIGGGGGTTGGVGTAGSTLSGGSANSSPNGGGGGGGGAGIIRVFPTQPLGGMVSPPAT